jgi:transposase, IS30 family
VLVMGRSALPVEVQRRFGWAMCAGVVLDDAVVSVGVSKAVAWRWFREAGGVIPTGIHTDRARCSNVAIVVS